jgi:hypothetical protein
MRYRALVISTLFLSATAAEADVSILIGEPSVSIGVNLRAYPDFVRVPGYPVYYAPNLNSNVFFYDGMYWVYEEDRWYASTWYNGPWGLVSPEGVPLYVLRVPVRYYRSRPAYFTGWAMDAPPRWGDHWGSAWQQQRTGWDSWDRKSSPTAAPLPTYQRQYSGDRYPQLAQQQQIQVQQYRYQPRDNTVQQYYRQQTVSVSSAPAVQQKQATQPSRTNAASATRNPQPVQSTQVYAPGQRANQDGVESAKSYAPGQVKQQQGAQSAKEFAPGQIRKQQTAQSPPALVPSPPVNEQRAPAPSPKQNGNSHNNKGNADEEGDGNRGDNGKGKDRGHGKE